MQSLSAEAVKGSKKWCFGNLDHYSISLNKLSYKFIITALLWAFRRTSWLYAYYFSYLQTSLWSWRTVSFMQFLNALRTVYNLSLFFTFWAFYSVAIMESPPHFPDKIRTSWLGRAQPGKNRAWRLSRPRRRRPSCIIRPDVSGSGIAGTYASRGSQGRYFAEDDLGRVRRKRGELLAQDGRTPTTAQCVPPGFT